MSRPVPVPETDLSPADWLATTSDHDRGTVASHVTGGFAAYARILHRPDQGRPSENEPASWAEVARRHGTVLHPAANYDRLARAVGGNRQPEDGAPLWGSLDPMTLVALRDVLATVTGASATCWLGLWEGFGTNPRSLESALTFDRPLRRHWLFRGSLADLVEMCTEFEYAGTDEAAARGALNVVSSRPGGATRQDQIEFARNIRAWGWVRSPSLWWPADHAWLVATDTDLNSSFVGGSQALIDRLVSAPGVEALVATATTGTYDDADTIN